MLLSLKNSTKELHKQNITNSMNWLFYYKYIYDNISCETQVMYKTKKFLIAFMYEVN